MPVELGVRVPPAWPGVPPHMSSADLPIWRRWQARHVGEFLGFFYDVGLGEGLPATAEVLPEVAAAWKRLTQKRVDALGEKIGEWWVIEVRTNAGPGALGAVQTYRELWRRDPPDARPLRVWIVTDNPDPDLVSIADGLGIEVEVV